MRGLACILMPIAHVQTPSAAQVAGVRRRSKLGDVLWELSKSSRHLWEPLFPGLEVSSPHHHHHHRHTHAHTHTSSRTQTHAHTSTPVHPSDRSSIFFTPPPP